MHRYVVKINFFCYWLSTYAIISPRFGKTRTFFVIDWLLKYTFASPKSDKIHTFFHYWLFEYAFDLLKIGKIRTILPHNYRYRNFTYINTNCKSLISLTIIYLMQKNMNNMFDCWHLLLLFHIFWKYIIMHISVILRIK